MPVRSALRLRPLGDVWHKPALSSVAALAVVLLGLVRLGRLDLVLYGAGGAMCALYCHGLPYAARARALAWVVLGMVSSMGAALVIAALTDSVAVRVAAAAALAGLHKAASDATRLGPPGNVVLTFIAASAAFVPQRLSDVPLHVGVGLLGGAVAWAVGMAPGLVRRDGPERVAVARALESTARLLRARTHDDVHQARAAAAAAVNAAWQTLLRSGDRREELRRLLVRAESAAVAVPGAKGADGTGAMAATGTTAGAAPGSRDAETLIAWAQELRKGRAAPVPPARDARLTADEQAELAGVAAEASGGVARRRFVVEVARRWRSVVTVTASAGLAGWARWRSSRPSWSCSSSPRRPSPATTGWAVCSSRRRPS